MCIDIESTRRTAVTISDTVYRILQAAMDIQADVSANRIARKEMADRYADLAVSLRDAWVGVSGFANACYDGKHPVRP